MAEWDALVVSHQWRPERQYWREQARSISGRSGCDGAAGPFAGPWHFNRQISLFRELRRLYVFRFRARFFRYVDSERDLDITAPLFAAIKSPKPDNGRSPERITIAALARIIAEIAKIIIGQKHCQRVGADKKCTSTAPIPVPRKY